MIAKATFYKGIEFICVDTLPGDQQLLLQHAQHPERIKILIDGKILSNCIQYKEYNDWYTSVYSTSIPIEANTIEEKVPVKIALKQRLA